MKHWYRGFALIMALGLVAVVGAAVNAAGDSGEDPPAATSVPVLTTAPAGPPDSGSASRPTPTVAAAAFGEPTIYDGIGPDELSPVVADDIRRVYVPNGRSNTVSVIEGPGGPVRTYKANTIAKQDMLKKIKVGDVVIGMTTPLTITSITPARSPEAASFSIDWPPVPVAWNTRQSPGSRSQERISSSPRRASMSGTGSNGVPVAA